MERLPHEAALGAFVGNELSNPSTLMGLGRSAGVFFEYGDIETSHRIERCDGGFVVVDRDRAREHRAAQFSHVDDAERFVAIRDGLGRSAGPWFGGRATAPDDVQVTVVRETWTFSWRDRSDEHVVRAFGVPEASAAYRLCRVRALAFERVMEVVISPSPMRQLRELGALGGAS